VIVLQADDIDRSRRTELLIEDAVWTPGDTFRLGSDDHYPEEAPSHHVTLDGFWIDRTPVTNRQFNPFVNATGTATAAEIGPAPKNYRRATRHDLCRLAGVLAAGGREGSARRQPVLDLHEGRELATPLWIEKQHQGARRPSGGACVVQRRARLRQI
jgi:formylglycine-generating enzyme required for sulfatase activity